MMAQEHYEDIAAQLQTCLADLQVAAKLGPGDMLVVGASTSEVSGQRIGTATSLAIGRVMVQQVLAFTEATGCDVAFQCCEHLNRALVVARLRVREHGWTEVSAIPVPGAGGAVAAEAYRALPDACLVESIQADAGIDIGDTLIGMHLCRVAVPVRGTLTAIGAAHVTMAKTRPPLIGGTRAVYDAQVAAERLELAGAEVGANADADAMATAGATATQTSAVAKPARRVSTGTAEQSVQGRGEQTDKVEGNACE